MDEISGISSSQPTSEGEQVGQAEGAIKQAQSGVKSEAVYSSTVSTMGELKQKYPDVYDSMQMAIIKNMLRNIESFPDRLKRARRAEEGLQR